MVLGTVVSELLSGRSDKKKIIIEHSADILEVLSYLKEEHASCRLNVHQAVYTALLADVALCIPHVRGFVRENLITQLCCLDLGYVTKLSAAEATASDVVAMLSILSQHLAALRLLSATSCLDSEEHRLNIDLGCLLSLQSLADARVRYHSVSLACDLLNLPQAFKINALHIALQGLSNGNGDRDREHDNHHKSVDELLAQLMSDDLELFQVNVFIGTDTAVTKPLTPATAVLSDNDSVSTDTAIALRPLNLPTVHVAGYTLPTKLMDTETWVAKMIMTNTTFRNVQRLAQAVALNVPVIVQGEVGCGKSFLVKELAAMMGQESTLVDLHLDDQTDSKTLIGAYVCSDVPGEFLWQPGVVTQAAMKGRWLVIEDIDRVPLEVAASLSALLERRRLYLPDRGREVPVHPGFRIFGTRSVSNSDASTSAVISHAMQSVPSLRHFSYLWHFVNIEVPTTDEIEVIITTRFPTLLPIVVKKLLETYMLFGGRSMHHGGNSSSSHEVSSISLGGGDNNSNGLESGQLNAIAKRFSRQFTLRDIMKAARRCDRYSDSFNTVSGLLTDELRRNLLCEIVDVFAAAMRDSNAFIEVVRALGRCWGVADCDIDGAVFMAQPQLHLNANASNSDSDKTATAGSMMTIGRVAVAVASSTDTDKMALQQQFAFTKYSLRMLERVAACVSMGESVLLVGETGAGKTTSVQELANLTHRKLIVQNLSLSTDASDLLGGYRPVSLRQLFLPSYERFLELFADTFSSSQNSEFVAIVAQTFRKQQWKKLLKAFQKASENAMKKIIQQQQQQASSTAGKKDDNGTNADDADASSSSDKKKLARLQLDWKEFSERSARFEANLPRIEVGFAFAFVDGLLVDAMRRGYWVLLDEINLAAPETLQALAGVLDGQSLCMTERGDTEPVPRHPDFRLFAAMNPPTDVGKRELPIALRSRFTELYCEELTDPQDLRQVVERVLSDDGGAGSTVTEHIDDIVSVYLGCRASAEVNLVDGSGQRPRFSLRSLTRSLRASKAFMDVGLRPFNRTLFEGFLLNFQTLLDGNSRTFMWSFLKSSFNVTNNAKELSQPPQRPGGKKLVAEDWVLVKPFWLRTGKLTAIDWAAKDARGITKFVLTATVDAAVRNLAAAIAAGVAPVLLQGPTSVGKTSMIEYLAARTGHKCVRINNHEHTDVQEYVGGYVTNQQGHLEFRDGLLVDALRNGHWIILDELNLAPSDVLEALNRLLDDNKELLIPETGEVVRPSQGFTLFATQNPAGAYGGRKPLSRAFRNRFLELNVSDLPSVEIEDIITQSCGIAPKYSKMLVGVMNELQTRRQQSHLFQGKYGAITTRDLIKWGKRLPQSGLEVAAEGYMMLAERLRNDDEKSTVLEVINKVCKVKLDVSTLYEMTAAGSSPSLTNQEVSSVTGGDLVELVSIQDQLRNNSLDVEGVRGVAITTALRRMWKLTGRCVAHDEPSLLIGETGCGKTMVCQLLAAHSKQKIRILNCHQSTETADIIGGLRPVRGRAKLLADSVDGIIDAVQQMDLAGIDPSASSFAEKLQTANRIAATATATGSSSDRKNTVGMKVDKEEEEEEEEEEVSFDDVEVKQALDELQVVVDSVIKNEVDVLTAAAATLAQQEATEDGSAAAGAALMSPKKKTKREQKAAATALANTPDPTTVIHKKYAALRGAIDGAKHSWQRSKTLFEWHDGPLVTAMKEGDMFLLDEINLAEDAVIERINSVLESSREITLAEKGGIVTEKIIAHPSFKFLATMNPGGDFGKRELSPALRSRFTEIWIPNANSAADITLIVAEILQLNSDCATEPQDLAAVMVSFMNWLNEVAASSDSEVSMKGIQISVRELLAWAKFVTQWEPRTRAEAFGALLHGAHMVLLDGLGIGQSVPRETVWALKRRCMERLLDDCPEVVREEVKERVYMSDTRMSGRPTRDDDSSSSPLLLEKRLLPVFTDDRFELKGSGFSVPLGPNYVVDDRADGERSYVLNARSVTENLCRIMRAMQLPRPILLEGPPGVGKSSIIANLAKLTGHNLVRINLSEHSEISDLLGSDLPAPTDYNSEEDGTKKNKKSSSGSSSSSSGPKFCWCDGVFLTALKRGDWVLLDELNLAPQSVLEGLNACLDHRGEVFIPEIGRSFFCPPSFRVFCAQNPAGEGGGRKGLPQSFLTRFSRVFVEAMDDEDMMEISMQAFVPERPITSNGENQNQLEDLVRLDYLATTDGMLGHFIPTMVRFIQRLQSDIVDKSLYGGAGSPWEFNLRDIFRWCELVKSLSSKLTHSSSAVALAHCVISESAYLLFSSRMRTQNDRDQLAMTFSDIFGWSPSVEHYPPIRSLKASHVVIGSATLPVHCHPRIAADISDEDNLYNQSALLQTLGGLGKTVETLAHCVSLKWPILIVGPSGTGKRRCIRQLASLTGNAVVEFSATSSTDSTELLGAFEQASAYRHLRCGVEYLEKATLPLCLPAMTKKQKTSSSSTSSSSSSSSSAVPSYLTAAATALSLLSHIHRESLVVTANNALRLKQGKDLFDLLQQALTATWSAASTAASSAGLDLPKIQTYLSASRACFDHCYAECNVAGGSDASSSAPSGLGSGFEWVDGVVVRALEEGHWLLIDNVNLCSASVLDRLNSLLEPGGSLLLTETGIGRVVTPHPDFRIFLCMDPSHGEISRAMRNRCVEISTIFRPDLDAAAVKTLLRSDIHPLMIQNGGLSSSSSSSSDAVMEALRHVYSVLAAPIDHHPVHENTSSNRSKAGKDKSSRSKAILTIADSKTPVVHLPPGMPRMRLFSRLIRLAVLEQRCGRSASEAVARAIRAVLPSLESLAQTAAAIVASSSSGKVSAGVTVMVVKRPTASPTSILASIQFLPAEVFAGLRLVTMTSSWSNKIVTETDAVMATHHMNASVAEDWRWLLAASKSSRDRAQSEKRAEPDLDISLASLSLTSPANTPASVTVPIIKPEDTLRGLALSNMASYDESVRDMLSSGVKDDDGDGGGNNPMATAVAKSFAMAHLVAAVVSYDPWVGHLVTHTLKSSGYADESEAFVSLLCMLTSSAYDDLLVQQDVHSGPEVSPIWQLIVAKREKLLTTNSSANLSKSLVHQLLDIRRRQHMGHLASIVATAELQGTSTAENTTSLDEVFVSGDACWALLDMLVLSRLSIIQEEQAHRKLVDDALSLSLSSSGSAFSSLWAVGYAVNRGRLVAESRDLQVLSALHSVLSAVNTAVRNTASALVSDDSLGIPDERVLQALDLVVKRRDMLSKTLMLAALPEQGDLGSSLTLPWEPIIVCIGWVKKSLATLSHTATTATATTTATASYNNELLRSCAAAAGELRSFDKAMAEYWRRPSFDTCIQGGDGSAAIGHAKLRLWKEGGHASVPAVAGKWEELRAVRDIVAIADYDGGALQLPNFVDTQVGRTDVLTSQRSRRLLASMSLLKEWLSLYSTFYWAHTDESSGSSEKRKVSVKTKDMTMDMRDLAEALKLRFQEYRRGRTKKSTAAAAASSAGLITDGVSSMDLDSSEFAESAAAQQSDADVSGRVKEEWALAGELSLTLLSEPLVLTYILRISMLLAELLQRTNISAYSLNKRRDKAEKSSSSGSVEVVLAINATVEDLERIRSLVAAAIAAAIRYTLFDISHLRELQTLLWSTEAVLDGRKDLLRLDALLIGKTATKLKAAQVTDITKKRIVAVELLQQKESELINLSRNFIVQLDLRLGQIAARSLFGGIDTVEFHYGSRTLSSALESDPGMEGGGAGGDDDFNDERGHWLIKADGSTSSSAAVVNVPWTWALFTGFSRLLQPTSLDTVLRHVDICVVSPQVLGAAGLGLRGKSSMGLLTNGVAAVTVSSSRSAQRRLLQLFRLSVANANSRTSFNGNSNKNSKNKMKSADSESLAAICRLSVLVQYTLDIIISCRDFYSQQLVDELSALMASRKAGDSAVSRKLFSSLVDLNIPSKCTSQFIADIFAKCLVSVLEFLAKHYRSNDDTPAIHTDTETAVDLVSVGNAWVKIGLLRLHLSVPMTPIDPATKSAVKASLLSRGISTLKSRIQVSHWHATLSGGPTIPPEASRAVAEMKGAETRVTHLTARAIQRPDDAPSFEDLFFEIRSVCDGLADITRILTLLNRTESAFNSLRSVFLTAQKHKCKETDQELETAAKEAFNELLASGQEELSLQGSITAFSERCRQSFDAYEDIYSPVLSAAMNISTGLRIVTSWCNGQAEDMVTVLTAVLGPNRDKTVPRRMRFIFAASKDADQVCTSATDVVADGWRSLMLYPHSSYIHLGGSNDITSAALSSVKELLLTSDLLVSRAAKCLEDANTALESSGSVSDAHRLPRPDTVRSAAPRQVLLLTLSKLDYLVGGGVVPPSTAGGLFGAILSRFVQEHLNAEEERKRKEAIKAATYRNKMQETTFESDPEKEEMAALRVHFPDHLKEFKDVTESARGPDGQILSRDDDQDSQNHEDDDVAARAVDEKTTALLVGYHARMVFLHFSQQLRAAGIVWLKSDTISSIDNGSDSTLNLHLRHKRVLPESLLAQRESLANVLAASSLMAAKSLDRGLQRLMAPVLEGELRGGALNALATMADCCRSIGLSRSSRSWLTDILGDTSNQQISRRGSRGKGKVLQTPVKIDIDRDFLLLLDPTVQGPWHPSDFHADPNIEEAAQASDPLRKLFDRASDVLELFPGNELLVQVCKVSARIAEFAVSTPLGKLLISLQLLLSKAQEWEQFAASHVSLRVEMAVISALIGRWRELELRSWGQLLRCKELTYVKNALDYWFTLARALHTSPDDSIIKAEKPVEGIDAISSSSNNSRWPTLSELAPNWLWSGRINREESLPAVDSRSNINNKSSKAKNQNQKSAPMDEHGYLAKIFEVLNAFVSSCVVGEFPTRVHLVRLFALQLEQEALLNDHSHLSENTDKHDSMSVADTTADSKHQQRLKRVQKRVAHVAMGIWRYYEQFVSTMRSFQDTLRDPIETRLKGEVKIGKWDQMSTYGLIEHSEKIHRKLNKFIREYQSDVLEYPVAAVLRRSLIGDLASEQGDLKAATLIPTMVTIFPVLKLLHEEPPAPPTAAPAAAASTTAAANANGSAESKDNDNKEEEEEDEEEDEEEAAALVDCADSFLTAVSLAAAHTSSTSTSPPSSTSQGADNQPLVERIYSQFPKLSRADTLSRKMDQYLRSALVIPTTATATATATAAVSTGSRAASSWSDWRRHMTVARFGYLAAETAEGICDEIFSRINSLRSESVPKSAKHRAVADLLHRLRDEGISHLKSNAPPEVRQSVQLLSLPAVLSCEIAADLHWNSASPKGNFEKSERYFIRNVAELDQLRAQAAAPSAKDVSSREIGLMVALSENLFCTSLRSRCALAAGLDDRRSVLTSLYAIEDMCEVGTVTANDTTGAAAGDAAGGDAEQLVTMQRKRLEYIRRASNIMLDNMLQMRRLLVTARAAHSSENLEEDVPVLVLVYSDKNNTPCSDAGAVVSVSVIDRAITAADSIIARIQSLSDSSSGSSSGSGKASLETYNANTASAKLVKERARDLIVSASFGGFHLSSSSSLYADSVVDSDLAIDSADITRAAGTLASFDDVYDLFVALISNDVVAMIRQRLSEYVHTIQSPLVFSSSSSSTAAAGVMEVDVEVEVQGADLNFNIGESEAAVAHAITATIDECLVTVQKIRTLAGQGQSEAASSSGGGSKLPKEGCFGESIDITNSSNNDNNGSAIGDTASPSASRYVDVLSLAASSVAAVQGHRLAAALKHLHQQLEKLPASGAAAHKMRELALSCVRPLVLRVLAADAVLLRDLCDAYKGAGKLLYVVLRVFRTLLAKGLCSDETKEEEGEGGGEGGDAGEMKFEDDVEGTGMGEGEGKKDVSDQIENEEQLLGLKDDKPQDDDAAQKKEKQESKQLKDEEKDKGIEMSQDFDGDMYDLPEEPEDTKEDEGKDEDDEEELDREMGDANPDDVVDEKQWDDEEDELEEKGEDQKEKFEKDSKVDGETLDGETRTKEEEDDDDKGEEKGGKEKEEGSEPKKEEDEQGGKDGDDDKNGGDQDNSEGKVNEEQEEDVMEKPMGVDVRKEEKEDDSEGEEGDEQGGAPVDDQEQEAGEGEDKGDELPDDMRLDGGSDGEGEEEDGEGERGAEEPPIDEDGNEAENDENKMDEDDDQAAEEKDPEGDGMQMSGGGNINDEENKEDEEDEQKDDEGENAEEAAKEIQGEVEGQKQDYRAPAFGVQAKGGKDTVLGAEEEKEGTGNADDAQEEQSAQAPPPASQDEASRGSDGARQGSGTDGSKESASGPPQEGDPQSRERQPPNPFKQRGDINKAWHRRLNIMSPEDQQDEDDGEDGSNEKSMANEEEGQEEDGDGKGQYEHTHDQDRRAGDEQVLADVAEEDAVQLPQTGERSGPTDENQQNDQDAADSAMLDDDNDAEEKKKKKSREERKRDRRDEADQGDAADESMRKRSKADSDAAKEAKRLADEGGMDVDGSGDDGSNDGDDDGDNQADEDDEDEEEVDKQTSKEDELVDAGAKIFTNDTFRRDGSDRIKDDDQKDKDKEEEDGTGMEYLEDTAHKDGSSMTDARHQWSRQRSATESHAIRLCEQLRLVLEPTLATRLQGDYRTGKRINMRRVVGYVASGFRKDKIWLRRTKPAKREYQVMVMIDNSSSMGDAGPLALSALATLSTALTRLEVGQLCVAAFASDVKIVHPFGQPFDDEAGARALTHFDFSAQRTLLGASLEAVEPIFSAAKAGTSGATGVVSAAGGSVVLQLCFVISDARIDSDNRTRLDRIVRDFADQNVLVVLVIIDRNADPKDSIFNTRSVEFKGDKVVTSSYMDGFPFPYYVAINKLEVLPDVLSDALKQWFEMVGAQLSSADKK